jgi:hypothetical protein
MSPPEEPHLQRSGELDGKRSNSPGAFREGAVKMKTSVTVFVCSTYSDLVDERNAVLEAIRRLQLRHDSMEFFGARANAPIETCLEEVRRSDVLVIIVVLRYGSLVPGEAISFSEAEYVEGYHLGKPCLVYLRDENVPVLPRHFERDPENLRRLESFKDALKNRHTPAYFQDPTSLAVQVTADLASTVEAFEEESARVDAEQRPQSPSKTLHEVEAILQDALDKGVSHDAAVSAIRKAVSSLLGIEGRREPLAFLSYPLENKEVAMALATELHKEGVDVWDDEHMAKDNGPYFAAMEEAIMSADLLVPLVSRASNTSPTVRLERNLMIHSVIDKHQAQLISVLLEDDEPLGLLRNYTALSIRDGLEKVARVLARAARHHMEGSPSS